MALACNETCLQGAGTQHPPGVGLAATTAAQLLADGGCHFILLCHIKHAHVPGCGLRNEAVDPSEAAGSSASDFSPTCSVAEAELQAAPWTVKQASGGCSKHIALVQVRLAYKRCRHLTCAAAARRRLARGCCRCR